MFFGISVKVASSENYSRQNTTCELVKPHTLIFIFSPLNSSMSPHKGLCCVFGEYCL